MIQRIYNAISKKSTSVKQELTSVHLGKIDEFNEEATSLYNSVEGAKEEIYDNVNSALRLAKDLNDDTKRAGELLQEGSQILVDIEDLGLPIPPSLEETLENLKQQRDLDAQQVVNSLENVNQLL